MLLSFLPCSVLRCSPQTLSAIAFVFLVASNVVAQDVAAEDAERPPSYASQPDAAGDEENANALLFPDHPRWMVSLLVGGAVAPLARGLQGEAHIELPWRMAMGFQGTYYRCDACDLGEEDGVDVEHLGVGFTYLGYSRPRGFFGGAVGYASGPSLFSDAVRRGPGPMAWFRWGRIRGVHLSGGFGVLRTRRAVELEGYSAALLFHLDLALPTFDTRGWSGRIDLRADLAVVDPTFATVTLGFVLRYRAVQAALRATIIDGNLAMTALLGVDLHRNRSALPTP